MSAEFIRRPDVKGRFLEGTPLPSRMPGIEIHKFYGEPAQLPARRTGDRMLGRSQYTEIQARRLGELGSERQARLLGQTADQQIRS